MNRICALFVIPLCPFIIKTKLTLKLYAMIKRLLAKAMLASMMLAFSLVSCNDDDSSYDFAPYKGREWYGLWNGDSVFLKLTSSEDAVFYSGKGIVPGTMAKYTTHRGMFPFSEFALYFDSVLYNVYYALFDPHLNMVIYGDSFDIRRDTALVDWQKPLIPTVPYNKP